ncbi:MAG: NAD(P)/FAD-dependent oxidoreductase [Halobacteriaceae archaeon]
MRVLVLGGGYAGLLVARHLQRHLPDYAELVVVDETGTHLIQHEVHRVIRTPDLADVLTIPLESVLEDATIRTARVTDIDPDAGIVHLDEESLAYDAAAVCLGATTTDHGIPGVTEYGLGLKSVADARAIRSATRPLLEDGGRVVVGGAGLSGIQIAGELAALRAETGADDRLEIRVLEQKPRVAPGFPDRFQDAVQAQLRRRGVDVQTGATIVAADADSVTLADDTHLRTDTFVWAGGIEGSTALDGARPRVRSDLRWAEDTFIAGDAAEIVDDDGELVPATAQAAVRAARVCARNVLASLDVEHTSLERFRFDNRGWLVSVGDGAVAQVGPAILTGAPARALKATVGVRYLATAGATREAVRVVRTELYD